MKTALYFNLASKLALIVLLTASNSTFLAQLSGKAFLSGQNSHAGITVRFAAVSTTAKSDSCKTDALGNYSINISGGVYKVQFAYSGYQTMLLNYGNSAVLTNSTVLQTVTLNPGSAIFVSGIVSGNWTNNHVYYAIGDLSVTANSTLTIQAGTMVKFLGAYTFMVNGALNAIGTSTSWITFTAADTLRWTGIYSGALTVYNYCLFEKGYDGISMNHSVQVVSCILNGISRYPIIINGGGCKIMNNDICNFGGGAILSGGGSNTISCNHIFNSPQGLGIRTDDDDLIENNHIHNVNTGFFTNYDCKSTIRNNYLHDTELGIHCINFWSPPQQILWS